MSDLKKITEILTEEEILDIEQRACIVALMLSDNQEMFDAFLLKFRLEFIEKKLAKKNMVGEILC